MSVWVKFKKGCLLVQCIFNTALLRESKGVCLVREITAENFPFRNGESDVFGKWDTGKSFVSSLSSRMFVFRGKIQLNFVMFFYNIKPHYNAKKKCSLFSLEHSWGIGFGVSFAFLR